MGALFLFCMAVIQLSYETNIHNGQLILYKAIKSFLKISKQGLLLGIEGISLGLSSGFIQYDILLRAV